MRAARATPAGASPFLTSAKRPPFRQPDLAPTRCRAPRDAKEPGDMRTFTVTIAGTERFDGEAPYTPPT